MAEQVDWYIVRMDSGSCEIQALDIIPVAASANHWGPFSSRQEAIAKRVGLIRAGKCQPQ